MSADTPSSGAGPHENLHPIPATDRTAEESGWVDLSGKIALVTGAGRGIGRRVALDLAARGARLVLTSRTSEQLEEVGAEILQSGGAPALVVPADVSSEPDVGALFARVRDEFGQLDVFIGNAGIGTFGPILDFPLSELDRIFATNVRGAFLCAQGAMRMMVPRRQGTIIHVASVVGFRGYPRQGAYTASKHALMGLTKSLAKEGAEHGIRVSAVLPGGVDTDLISDARPDLDRSQLLQPEDVSRTILFLLSLPERAAIDEIYIRRRTSEPF